MKVGRNLRVIVKPLRQGAHKICEQGKLAGRKVQKWGDAHPLLKELILRVVTAVPAVALFWALPPYASLALTCGIFSMKMLLPENMKDGVFRVIGTPYLDGQWTVSSIRMVTNLSDMIKTRNPWYSIAIAFHGVFGVFSFYGAHRSYRKYHPKAI